MPSPPAPLPKGEGINLQNFCYNSGILVIDDNFECGRFEVDGVWRFIFGNTILTREIYMNHQKMIEDYLAGPAMLRKAVSGMTREQLLARPVAGKWSTQEVVCHLADFEIVYADRIKRVIAEEEPALFGGSPDLFTARLAYHNRDLEEELKLVEMIRKQVACILAAIKDADFQRHGIHSEYGPLTLETILQRVTGHIPHHVRFIEEKRKAL
jgi:hypothetical protein